MDAKRDSNRIPSLLAASSTDGITPITLYADPVTHRLLVDDNGAAKGPASATDNRVAVFDGTTGKVIKEAIVATIGNDANFTDFPNAALIVSKGNSGHTYTNNTAIVGETVSAVGFPGIGVGGVAKTNGIFPAYGLAGRALVDATGSSGAAVGVEGISEATHAGGSNIAFYGQATGGLLNYSFYGNSGRIYNADATDATSISAASVVFAGGVGIAKKAYIGDDIFLPYNKSAVIGTTRMAGLYSQDIDNSIIFPGSSSYGTVPNNANIENPFNSFSIFIEAILSPTPTPAVVRYLAISSTGDASIQYNLSQGTDNSIRLRLSTATSGAYLVTTVQQWTDNKSHKILVIVDRINSSVSIYVDGVLQALNTATGTFPTPTADMTSGADFRLAAFSTAYTRTAVKRVQLFNMALSQPEVESVSYNLIPGQLKGGSQVNIIPAASSSFATDGTAYWNAYGTPVKTWDASGFMNIVANSTDPLLCGLGKASLFSLNKRYRVTCRMKSTNCTRTPTVSTYGTNVKTQALTTSWATYEFERDGSLAQTLLIYPFGVGTVAATDSVDIDDIVVTQLGCTLDIKATNATTTKAYDNSGNSLDMSLVNATLSDTKGLRSDTTFYLDGSSDKTILMERNPTVATPGSALTLQGGGAYLASTDKSGGNMIIAPGISTGTGDGHVKILRNNRAASTGTADNAQATAMIPMPPKYLTDNSAIGLFEVSLPSGAIAGGQFLYSGECTNGTDHQSHSGVVTWCAVNKAGTITATIAHSSGAGGLENDAVSAGTITDTWTIVAGTNKVTITVNVNSSLTPTMLRIMGTIINNSMQVITLL